MSAAMRVLVAGVGNVFLGDDGWGVEVARRLAEEGALPDGVTVADFGVAGIHLAYELCDGWDAVVLLDAAPHGGPPGHVAVLAPDALAPASPALLDGHGMTPETVLGLLSMLGGRVERVLVVGCEPVSAEQGMALSAPVAAAVPEGVRLAREAVSYVLAAEGAVAPIQEGVSR